VSSRNAVEAEIRAVCAEMVGALRVISEGAMPLSRSSMRAVCLELEHELANLSRLAGQLP
jgi:hypothetical protein